jgi:threonine aldolase
VDPATVDTNIVFVDLGRRDAAAVTASLAAEGVMVAALGPSVIRAVTHRDVDGTGIDRAIDAFARAVAV